MVTAYVRRDVISRSGVRVRTYKKDQPPSLIGGLQTTRNYFASSNSVTTGDFVKPNPFYFTKMEGVSVGYEATQTDPNSNYATEVGFASTLDQTSEGTSNGSWQENTAYEQALADLVSNLRGDTDLAINLFQLKQLNQLLTRMLNLTSSFTKTVKAVKSGWGTGSKELSGLYLEYIYGLRPLILDAYNTFSMLMQQAMTGKAPLHFRGRGKSVEGFDTPATIVAFSVATCPVTIKRLRSVRCQIDIHIRPDLSKLQKLGSYTSLNPVSWAWEVLPYSFVIDWFWNFGGYLRALETALLYSKSFVSGCKTQTIHHQYSCGGSGKSTSHPSVTYAVTCGSRVIKYYERTVLNTMPVPLAPTLKMSLSPWRIVNAVALLLQLQSPKKRKKRTGKPRRNRL